MNDKFPKLSDAARKTKLVRDKRKRSADVIAFEPRAAAMKDLRNKIRARASAHEEAGASDRDEY